jgi:hypothetical protein
MLWQLLADWLCLLKLEFNKEDNSVSENNQTGKSVSNQDSQPESDQSDNQAASECNTGVDLKACDEEKILKSLCMDQDVVGVILPRICGIIHAFYICCTCQHGHPQ